MRLQAVETIAEQFVQLDEKRQRLERECRELKKSLESLRDDLQKMVGVAEDLDIPLVVRVGNYCITQTKKHREVRAYEYDFVEFKVVEVPSTLNNKS